MSFKVYPYQASVKIDKEKSISIWVRLPVKVCDGHTMITVPGDLYFEIKGEGDTPIGTWKILNPGLTIVTVNLSSEAPHDLVDTLKCNLYINKTGTEPPTDEDIPIVVHADLRSNAEEQQLIVRIKFEAK
jgi:hypothetical protein